MTRLEDEWRQNFKTGIKTDLDHLFPYLEFKVKIKDALFTNDCWPECTIVTTPSWFPRFEQYSHKNRYMTRTVGSQFEREVHIQLNKYANRYYNQDLDIRIKLSFIYREDSELDEKYIMHKLKQGL